MPKWTKLTRRRRRPKRRQRPNPRRLAASSNASSRCQGNICISNSRSPENRLRRAALEETMDDIKKLIADLALKRGRAVAKSDAIYDNKKDARDGEDAMSKAKNPKDFDKKKKECLASVDAGEKAVKPWQKEMDDWDQAIADL